MLPSTRLEAERREYYEKREALERAIAPMVKLLMLVDNPCRIIYNPKTREMKREYSPETQAAMDKINAAMEMCREYYFPSNDEARRGYGAQRNIRCLRRLDLRGKGVEMLGGKICSVRPSKRMPFKCELLEIFRVFQRLENRAIQFVL